MVTVNRLSSSRFLHGPDVKRILPFLSPLRLDKSDHHGPVPAVLHRSINLFDVVLTGQEQKLTALYRHIVLRIS